MTRRHKIECVRGQWVFLDIQKPIRKNRPCARTYLKITSGFVIQRFDEKGEFICQVFTADDSVEYEIEEDETRPIESKNMPLGGDESFPFNMVQE